MSVSRFASSLLACLLLAAPALAAEGSSTSFSHRMAQGRFLLDGGLAAQAVVEFQQASAMEAGRTNAEVHHLLARAAWLAGQVPRAMEAVRRAWALADGRAEPELASLHEFLTTRFGKVLVIGGGSEDARLPEPAVPLLDPELKRVFEAALRQLQGTDSGSTSVYMPVGAYRVGPHLVEVSASGTTTLDLRPTVGVTASGVYGESAQPRATGPRPPPPPAAPPASPGDAPPLQHHLAIAGSGAIGRQQGDPVGQGEVVVGWEPWVAGVLAVRVGAVVGLQRLERIQTEGGAPLGGLVGAHLGVGGLGPLPGGASMGPWLSWQVAYGRPMAEGLPANYPGPGAYTLHGPDLAARIALPSAGPMRGVVEVGARLREYLPRGAERGMDEPPHLSVGGGLTLTLLVGGGA